jgi:hypothetical protein
MSEPISKKDILDHSIDAGGDDDDDENISPRRKQAL